MDSQSIVSTRIKPRTAFFSTRSLSRMTRSSTDRAGKLRRSGRKLKAHFKSRPLSTSSYYIPPQELRTVKSAFSLKPPVRDLAVHQVSEPTPVPSIRHRSVRFSHPAVRHVIAALPTPLSEVSRTIPEFSCEYESPVNVDFPGQVNPSAIHNRRSIVTSTVLFEEIFDQLDGVLAHPRDSRLLQRREAKKRAGNERRSTMFVDSHATTAGKPWPVEGICGTKPAEPTTKSGLRALQYLSFHAPIREEAFSDEAIFGISDVDSSSRSREQHLQATLDQLSTPRGEAQLPAPTPHLQADVEVNLPFDRDASTRLPYLAFKAPFPSDLTDIPLPLSTGNGKQPASQRIQHTLEWEKALRTVQQRGRASGIVSPAAPNITLAPATPDFPSTQTIHQKRRTLQQSTALDLCLATPSGLPSAVTPSFPVLNQEREQRRRTILGEQQRDLALTPATTTGLPPSSVPKPLPRTFSIPRRGVGQPSKSQAVTGLPLPVPPRPDTAEQPQCSSSATTVPAAPVTLQTMVEAMYERRNSSLRSQETLESEFPTRPKRSRFETFKMIVTKNY